MGIIQKRAGILELKYTNFSVGMLIYIITKTH